ncbi:hypothetical protein DXG03_009390 [Asterophora parasitica]|uniref:Protein kinase domain-containing protein n=1 Tax=Asterophora parasitica TaxID=117018 RepID=A0A9P7KFF9_9AGAR|nr:hypothetical protein DXG03_009390 [Asterophora parasitica]
MAPPHSPTERSPRGHRRRPSRPASQGKDGRTTSPVPSPGEWSVDRGRSRVRRSSNPFSEENLRRKGYHSLLSSFGKVFHVEKRWKLIREMGSGAYGVVIQPNLASLGSSAADEISGETVAIKLVTRVFDKVQLAKRALREITLLRHFANHENITGLIDVDAISPDFNEIPWKIIKSGQTLTNEHVQYFLYQILRGMKYVHSASVIHRDLKPGNLLVNADCELKICDFGLSRGFESRPDENATHLTEYVATRWYRAPEIMLAFRRYSTATMVSEHALVSKDSLSSLSAVTVDQLNKVLDVLGTPDERAQAYVRSLPFKKTVPFRKIIPAADPQALDLLAKMLAFNPSDRITVPEALEHPWLAAYHDESDEPECAEKFEKWRKIEELETLDDFRAALWNEIEEYRREVRGIPPEDIPSVPPPDASPVLTPFPQTEPPGMVWEPSVVVENIDEAMEGLEEKEGAERVEEKEEGGLHMPESLRKRFSSSPENYLRQGSTPTDPVVTYARRSSILQPSRQGSTYTSPMPSTQQLPTFIEDSTASLGAGTVVFPSQQGYVVPARSRTGSMAGGEVTRRLLRTLSTVSIHESVEGLAGGLAGIAPIGKYIVENEPGEEDAPPSEMPREFGPRIAESPEGEEENSYDHEHQGEAGSRKTGREGKFRLG